MDNVVELNEEEKEVFKNLKKLFSSVRVYVVVK